MGRIQDVLNIDLKSKYILDIIATDPEGITAMATLAIRVIESNDPPVMESFTLYVQENAKNSELRVSRDEDADVGKVRCTDSEGVHPLYKCVGSLSDMNKLQKLHYEITGGNHGNSFVID